MSNSNESIIASGDGADVYHCMRVCVGVFTRVTFIKAFSTVGRIISGGH